MSDRFVLTPALRVMDGTQPDSKKRISEVAPVEETRTAANRMEPELSFVRAEPLETDIPDETGEWERVTEGDTEATAPFSSSRTALEARIAELEAAVASSREEWEPDGSEPDAKQMPERHIFAQTEAVEETPAPSQTTDEKNLEEAVPLSLAKARLSAMASVAEGEVGVDPDATAKPAPAGDVLVDEETLRELVADIVRQELQGALGERITRNVRRMVRREIQQALALKDFQ
ncbi:MAG: hypothetical protein WBN04_06315 [Paracoccaceae bacterium]